MREMFQSATIKLTAWYLLFIMIISITFSVTIYRVALNELSSRFDNVQSEIEDAPRFNVPSGFVSQLRLYQGQQAQKSLKIGLYYTNLLIFVVGGLGSYFLARRTLRPIEAANEAQSRFVGDASHELRTPLSIMKVELETALRDPKLSREEMKALLESNLEEVDNLTNLSHTLLQLSQFDQTGDKLSVTSFPIAATVEPIVERYNKQANRIIIDTLNGPIIIKANQASIEELISILIENALKYSPDNSKVKIKINKHGKYAHFTISNAGSGINSTDLPHIFDRFYRADTSRSNNNRTHGYGLGLSLAKKIVELNDGELTVTSAPDQITTFKVSLPLELKNYLKKTSL